MSSQKRMVRINDEIKRELAVIVNNEIKDPRLSVLTTITKVETTSDLKICKVYVSVLGNEKEQTDAIEGLKSASGFLRREIAQRINLRITPEFNFIYDDSAAYSIKMSKLIDDVNKGIEEK